jgi:hypothetical protein
MTTTSSAPRHRLTAAQGRLIDAQIQTFTPALDDALDEVERVLIAGIGPLPPDLRFFGLRSAMNILGNRLFDGVMAKCGDGDG